MLFDTAGDYGGICACFLFDTTGDCRAWFWPIREPCAVCILRLFVPHRTNISGMTYASLFKHDFRLPVMFDSSWVVFRPAEQKTPQ
jgi:hypothetical protein